MPAPLHEVEFTVVDVGADFEIKYAPALCRGKVCRANRNLNREAAMSREGLSQALDSGIGLAHAEKVGVFDLNEHGLSRRSLEHPVLVLKTMEEGGINQLRNLLNNGRVPETPLHCCLGIEDIRPDISLIFRKLILHSLTIGFRESRQIWQHKRELGRPSTRSSLVLKRAVRRNVMRLEGCQEARLSWNKWIRQTHRWLSMVFTAAVVINVVAIAGKKYTNSLGLLAVIPLALQFFTGLYLFVLPYATRRRARSTSRMAD